MAAIDKIYVNSYEEYCKFRDWCSEQPKLKDKYGHEESISDYLFTLWDNPKEWENGKSHPIFSAPYYVDAYLIRNCPFDYIQRELMFCYGHKTQEDINEMYNSVINRSPEEQKLIDEAGGKYPSKPISWWWLSKGDFEIVDGIIKIPHLEKSHYEMIKDGELYASPTREGTYEVGKHFKIVKRPFYQSVCNYPMRYTNKAGIKRQPKWEIHIEVPDKEYMWWHNSSKIGTWDFASEYVIDYKWASSSTSCPSLKSIKRRILKWKLPVGTVVTLQGRYVDEDYKIIVKR